MGINVTVERTWPAEIRRSIHRNEYELPELRILRDTLRPEDRYLEVGAAIGVVATAACAIVGDQRVTAVEANPGLIEIATRTARDNGYQPEIINAVLGDEEVPRTFYVHPWFWSSSLVAHEEATPVTVPGRSFLAELERTGATYLLVDIEGGEADLLDRPLPAAVRAICVELHPGAIGYERVNQLLATLMSQGFLIDPVACQRGCFFLSRG